MHSISAIAILIQIIQIIDIRAIVTTTLMFFSPKKDNYQERFII